MKRTLRTLIRLQRNEIDRLRQVHNRLLDIQDNEYAQIDDISQSIVAEQKYIHDFKVSSTEEDTVVMPSFGGFSQRMKEKRETHEQNIEKLTPEIEKSQIALTDAFAERKRYEIIQENQDKAQKKTNDLKQQQTVDEMTVIRFKHQEND